MHLTFSSSSANRLLNLVVKVESFTSKYSTCKSKTKYNVNLMDYINTYYRKVPDNLGILYSAKGLCALCHKKYEMSHTVRKLKCGHVFHKKCIDNWLIDHQYKCYTCNVRQCV